jgi:hypothetical protein
MRTVGSKDSLPKAIQTLARAVEDQLTESVESLSGKDLHVRLLDIDNQLGNLQKWLEIAREIASDEIALATTQTQRQRKSELWSGGAVRTSLWKQD